MHCTKAREESGLVNMRITSSANKLILCSFDPIVNPVIYFWELIFSVRGSIISLKTRGESGHPCLVLLVIVNVLDSIEEQYTWAEG